MAVRGSDSYRDSADAAMANAWASLREAQQLSTMIVDKLRACGARHDRYVRA